MLHRSIILDIVKIIIGFFSVIVALERMYNGHFDAFEFWVLLILAFELNENNKLLNNEK